MDQTGSIEQMIAQLLSGAGDPARPAGPPSPPPQTMWRTAPGMPSQPAPWQTGPRMMGAGTAPPPQPMPQQPMPQQQPAMPTQPALPTQAPGGQMNLEMLLQLLMQLFAPRGPGVAESRRSEP